jgi:ankyrin repeat protein
LPLQSLLSFTAFYGAQQCFSALSLNVHELFDDSISSSIKGGSLQIINSIEQLHGDFGIHFNEAVLYWRNEIADWIVANNDIKEVLPHICLISMNYPGLSFVFSKFYPQVKIQNLLCTAAKLGYYYFVFFMISSVEADVNIPNELGEFALHLAGEYGHFRVLKYLISHGADVNQISTIGATTLSLASKNGFTKIVSFLLSHGADPDISQSENLLPLFLAVTSGYFEIVKLLVEHCANINTRHAEDFTLLMLAIQRNASDIVRFLISHGANCETITPKLITPLHLACRNNYYEIVQILLKENVEINTKNYQNETPLLVASRNGATDIVLHLLTHGADVHLANNYHHTAFIEACSQGHFQIVKLLLFNDADINERTDLGETGLYMAALGGFLDTVKFLINNGADINVVTNEGISILKAASFQKHIQLVNYLFKNGVDDHLPQNAQLINFFSTSVTPLFYNIKLSQSVDVMFLPTNSASLTCLQLISFIIALPVSYEAKDSKKSDCVGYFRYYNICDSRDPKIILLRISSNQDFSNNHIEIINGAPRLNIITTKQQHGYLSQFYQESNLNLISHPTLKFEQFESLHSNHPYKKIGKNIKKKYPQHYQNAFSEEVLSEKTLRNRESKQFIIPLSDILTTFEGDVFLTVNPHLVTPFCFGESDHIRTMTWLIPNITTVLSKCQYIELDASFQASYPYVYTIPQAIIQNVAVPLGFTLAPTERMELYREFYDSITRAYPQFDLHWKIPILTDQGSGLIAFAKQFDMEQYFCFKHLLFKFIQNTPLYFLVRRILFSSTPEKLQNITNSIQLTAALIFQKSTAHQEAFESIFQWSYDNHSKLWTSKPNEFSNQMLWVRNPKGIGTTTNHAERFHRTMNSNTKKFDLPSKKTMNFRNNIVKKIKSNNINSTRQIQEFISNEQKRATKNNIIQVETCEKCDISRFRARFQCDVPCIHTCLAYDFSSIPPFCKISMKSLRPNKIHITCVEYDWKFIGVIDPTILQSEEDQNLPFLENQDKFDDMDYILYECQQILHLERTKIHKEFLYGAYSVFRENHRGIPEDEIQAMFTTYMWDEAAKKKNGIFENTLQKELMAKEEKKQ